MNKEKTLEKIISDLKDHRFVYTAHALMRMSERNINAIDVQYLINGPAINNHSWNENHQSWNFTGHGLSNEKFTIACCYANDDTLVVTVFWE